MNKVPLKILTIPALIAFWVVIALVTQNVSASNPGQNGAKDDLYLSLTFAPTMTPHDFLIIPTMNADSTPADYGAVVYRLVCSACHGDVGQGLTDQWRMTWNPKDQNCWQSKCHALNHPPDGFVLPHSVPPVNGANIRYLFSTALDLHDYIQANMPWQDKGSLNEKEYWELTSFLLQMNGINPGSQLLDTKSAAMIVMNPGQSTQTTGSNHPRSTQVSGTNTPQSAQSPQSGWLWASIPAGVLLIGMAIYQIVRRRTKR